MFNIIPPNGIVINDSLFCDKTEVGNIDYREYQSWVKEVFGINSISYKKTLLDSMLVVEFLEDKNVKNDSIFKDCYNNELNFTISPQIYFSHPSYDMYPMIGITYQQALDYSKWRSDRVYEMLLVEDKLIEPNEKPDSTNCFTIEKYLAGQYFNYIPNKKMPIPQYSLPTVEEWEMIAQINGGDEWGININKKVVKKALKITTLLFQTKERIIDYNTKNKYKDSYKFLPFTTPVTMLFRYNNQIYNLIGNVAEMTNTEGVSKGGSWFHTTEESKIKNKITYTKPEIWLGFRNVCKWRLP